MWTIPPRVGTFGGFLESAHPPVPTMPRLRVMRYDVTVKGDTTISCSARTLSPRSSQASSVLGTRANLTSVCPPLVGWQGELHQGGNAEPAPQANALMRSTGAGGSKPPHWKCSPRPPTLCIKNIHSSCVESPFLGCFPLFPTPILSTAHPVGRRTAGQRKV